MTPEAIAAFSRVGPDDVSSAKALWRRAAPRKVRKLLEAGKR